MFYDINFVKFSIFLNFSLWVWNICILYYGGKKFPPQIPSVDCEKYQNMFWYYVKPKY